MSPFPSEIIFLYPLGMSHKRLIKKHHYGHERVHIKYSSGFGFEGNTTRKAFRKLPNFIREAPESIKNERLVKGS